MAADNLTGGVRGARKLLEQTHDVFTDCMRVGLDANGIVLNRQLRHTSTEALDGCVFAHQRTAKCMQCNMVVICKLD